MGLSYFLVLIFFSTRCFSAPFKIQQWNLNSNGKYDPIACDKNSRGKMVLIKDRENNGKLLFCADEDGVWQWKTTDGTSSHGEFFNPGYDCSDILNKNVDAKDGFYWVNFHDLNKPRKVWCDMITDGGGYMLIGTLNDSVTWFVPSNDEPVKPFGIPHWSSALGHVPLMDFRVQVTKGDAFEDTIAHWSYRFNNKRPLGNLMILNQGGCGSQLPGIGDVAHVKDLKTETIVTKTFRCSRFSVFYHPSSSLGWAMMNSCLQKPCRYGFAYVQTVPVQVDFAGGFSFSALGTESGMALNSTAFIGCSKGKCCACYGPPRGKAVYCAVGCKSVNGGTITKNVSALFWVRSTLPKRIWIKCMEFKVKKNDDVLWYKLIGGSEVATEGRCSKNEVLINSGIVVVPDADTAKNIPSIPGLIVYHKDNKVLYLRGNETWNVIAQEKKMINLFDRLEKQLEDINQTLQNYVSYDDLSNSVILNRGQNYLLQLKQWLPVKSPWNLCYRATSDGWRASDFHSQCDYMGSTVTIIRVGSYVFGGYTDKSWGGNSGYKSSTKSFIFSLRNKDNLPPFKAPVYRYSQYAIYCFASDGPTFGGGHDINIKENAHSNTGSFTDFGYTYQPPSGYSYRSSNTRALLAGSYYFTVSEVEVFYLR